jgi:hypothetical protein
MSTLELMSILLPVLQNVAPDPEDVTQGWLGAVVFVLLATATVLLWLSFRKQLKKVDFEEEPDPPERKR